MRTPRPWSLPAVPTTLSELLAQGVSKPMIASRVRRGELIRLRGGVYLARSAWPATPDEQALVLARAEVAAVPDGVISHASAAVAWQLPHPGFGTWSDERASITLPRGGPYRSHHGQADHYVRELDDSDITRDANGWPVTTIVRTAVDLCAGREVPEALVILDAAARQLCASYVGTPRRRDYANPQLVDTARSALAQTARRCRRTSTLAGIELLDPSRESAAESLSAGHFHQSGLPRPHFQAQIRTTFGTFFPDCLWPERHLIGECDGALKYADAAGYVQEKTREQILRDHGFDFVRWQAKEIMLTPEVVVARVARALGL